MNKTLPDHDRTRVEALLRTGNKIQAVLMVRQITGLGLKEAVDLIDELQKPPVAIDDSLQKENAEMGMDADVLAIGQYDPVIAEHLAYSAEMYASTRPGTPIINVVLWVSSSTESRELAACFGIDPWDFNQHKFDPYKVDIARLKKLYEGDEEIIESFLVLREAGFEFFYRPNG